MILQKTISRFKWHLKELVKTLSEDKSFYSSKRIERMIIFLNANVLLDVMSIYLMKHDKLDYLGAVAIFSVQMMYAGYQTTQINKDKSLKDADHTK